MYALKVRFNFEY